MIQKKIEAISKIPTLPDIAVKLMQKTTDASKVNTSDIVKIIQKDTSLVSNVLKLVNSPFYNRGRSIGNLNQAIVFLGFKELRNLVISISIFSIYNSKNVNEDFKSIWHHLTNTAVVSQYVSQLLDYKSENVFIASLIHDLGKLLLAQNCSELVTDYNKRKTEHLETDKALEVEIFGMSHEDIGVYAATLWSLPENIIELVQSHHSVEISSSLTMDLKVLQLANYYTHAYEEQKHGNKLTDFSKFPLVEAFAEEHSEHDFLNANSTFSQYIAKFLDSSKEKNGIMYH
jgi:HD-like signal output (HDOD) protein